MEERDGRGQFVKGHRGGPGVSAARARRTAALRRVFLDRVSGDDVELVVRKLAELARRPRNTSAAREFFSRALGPAQDVHALERLGDLEETLDALLALRPGGES